MSNLIKTLIKINDSISLVLFNTEHSKNTVNEFRDDGRILIIKRLFGPEHVEVTQPNSFNTEEF